MLYRFLITIHCLFILLMNVNAQTGDLFSFPTRWDDASDTITNVSHLLDAPAGKNGFIRIEDDHFVDGEGNRVRFLGVNNSFSANFPTHMTSERIAAHMAKYGINCVRFHHTDTQRAPSGIWSDETDDKQTIDPKQLDRMDYFIYQLKLNGIYTNINLKIGRSTSEADGVPDSDALPTYDKGVDNYFPRLIELQKNYARDLLTHVNPYTGTAYINEPAIAMVEINNENGMLTEWNDESFDNLPESLLAPLRERWNAFLQKKYGSTGALRQAWAPNNQGTGEELMPKGIAGWQLEEHEEAQATMQTVPEGPNGEDCLKITVSQTSSAGWHVQSKYTPISVEGDQYVYVKLWLKANVPMEASLNVMMDHEPWQALTSTLNLSVDTEWKLYEVSFNPSQTDDRARLTLGNLGDQLGTIWVANPSMVDSSPLGLEEGEDLANQSVSTVKKITQPLANTNAKVRDWIAFLIDVETRYYEEMQSYLKDELGVQSIIAGTQLGFGTIPSQLKNDYIDHHGYWHHPYFPGQPWDSENWIVQNESIFEDTTNTIQRLMLARIEGYPYTVSEYNHPAPNTYASEAIPMLAAFAAFQDWDGIFYYCFSHTNEFYSRSINSFFDIAGHTPKMMAMPIAANMLLRGDIQSGTDVYRKSITSEGYLDILMENNASSWVTPMREMSDVPTNAPYEYRTELRFGDNPAPIENPVLTSPDNAPKTHTGHIAMNFTSGQESVMFRSPKTKGFVGFIPESFEMNHDYDLFDGVTLRVGDTIQNWANVLLSYMQYDEEGEHWLLTTTGYAENKGMEWKNEEKTSVGSNWGSGPAMIEAVPVQLTFANRMGSVHVYSLDYRGRRVEELTNVVTQNDDTFVIDLSEGTLAPWYEILFDQLKVDDHLLY